MKPNRILNFVEWFVFLMWYADYANPLQAAMGAWRMLPLSAHPTYVRKP